MCEFLIRLSFQEFVIGKLSVRWFIEFSSLRRAKAIQVFFIDRSFSDGASHWKRAPMTRGLTATWLHKLQYGAD